MRTSFLHVADMRLGMRHPADAAVFEQVAKQFRFVVDYALDQRASFVVFSGNLFDSPELDPETLQAAWRGLRRLAEKNVAAIAIRGRSEMALERSGMSWHDVLAQDGLLASLEPGLRESQLELRRWERRDGSGSYLDLGRCRVFGLPYLGALAGPFVQTLSRSIGALDNREMDFRVVLLHCALEHFTHIFAPRLTYSDLLMLRRHVDYVALGGVDQVYEAEGWAYNPGSAGFFHVTVDTAVQPKHIARHVAYPSALAVGRHAPPPRRPGRREIEEQVIERLLEAAPQPQRASHRAAARLVSESLWTSRDSAQLRQRVLELATQEPGGAA
jgi:hypothetical protein